jgi:hypothetical protein
MTLSKSQIKEKIMSLRLSKEHGLNPSIAVCFWCGEETGELVLLGHNKGREADRKAVYGYDPCPKCKEQMELGITIIEVEPNVNGCNRPPLFEGGPVPTGRFWVVKPHLIENNVGEPLRSQIIESGKCLLAHETAVEMGLVEPEPVH